MPIIYPASNNASGEVRIGNRKEGNAWEKFTDLEITSDPEGPDYLTISYKINNNEIKKHNVYFYSGRILKEDNDTIEDSRKRAAYIPSMATSMARPNRFNIKFVNPDRTQSEYISYSFSIDDQKKYEDIIKALDKEEENIQDFKSAADLKKKYENYLNKNNISKDNYTLKMFTDKEEAEEDKERYRFYLEKGYYDKRNKEKGYYGRGGRHIKKSKKRKPKNSHSLKHKSKTFKRKGSKKRNTRKVKKTNRARRKSTKKR